MCLCVFYAADRGQWIEQKNKTEKIARSELVDEGYEETDGVDVYIYVGGSAWCGGPGT